ncbi:MAG: 6-hydroxynicotinate reductase [Acidimicrobiales bacterium]
MTDIELGEDKVRCEACPVRCVIKVGQTGSCDRYGNVEGELMRLDPVVVLRDQLTRGREVVSFVGGSGTQDQDTQDQNPEDQDGSLQLTGVGAGTTYPDYKAAPFIVSQDIDGVDTITVVTEGIFSYCGLKVKIDTDRHIGDEGAVVLAEGHPVGLVTTAEYGSQMLSLGGVNRLTGGTRHEGLATMRTLVAACNREQIELQVEGGETLLLQAGHAPVIDGEVEQVMRIGCGSAAVGIMAERWAGLVDEVVVVDEHITGVLSEHQAGAVLGMPRSGIKLHGRRSTPGRFFNVADPGSGWGGTDLQDPLAIVKDFKAGTAWPGLRVLMTSTTGDDSAYFVLDEDLQPVPTTTPDDVAESIEHIRRNCEPAMVSMVFMAGAGGSLRAGTAKEPVALTESIQSGETKVTIGGAPVYLWPGGGITVMVDVMATPTNAFGYVPTPALVAPLEFTLSRAAYERMDGHLSSVVPLQEVLDGDAPHRIEDRRSDG